MKDKKISLIKARGFGRRNYKLFEFGMFADGPIHLLDSKGNITINPKYKDNVIVYENYSLDNMVEVLKQLSKHNEKTTNTSI